MLGKYTVTKIKKNLPSTLYPLLSVIALVIMTSCGYKPSSQLIKDTFADTVYVDVVVDKIEPENAPYLKDEINRLVYTRFNGRVASKKKAKSQIRVAYGGSTFIPVAYKDGYITRYRANVKVDFDMLTKKGRFQKTISTIIESDIQSSSLASSSLRTEAIRKGLGKALDEFLAYVSAKSAKNRSED